MKSEATMLQLFAIEIGVGLLFGLIAAIFIVPICFAHRGYLAVGSEWILIMAISYLGFMSCNKYIFNELERSVKNEIQRML